jgi:hypothetical protein
MVASIRAKTAISAGVMGGFLGVTRSLGFFLTCIGEIPCRRKSALSAFKLGAAC